MIALENVTKWYPSRTGRKYVFRDLDVVLPAGQHLALLGRNGAGKTTLLRLLGGIDHPSEGRIRSEGSVSWPVGLTGGFQGSLSGRENTRFVCRINGFGAREELREISAFIEEFAEIGDYFDMPVKTYSAGMRARLGFAMSMAFEFDWYLIDEVMAVGDQSFRDKCQQELESRQGKSTFIVASHNMQIVRRLCETGIVIEDGAVALYDIDEAVEIYSAQAGARAA